MGIRIASVWVLFFALGWAQHAASDEKPVVLYRGLGIWQHTIRTSSPDAQKYFNQGLALMYGFNRYEALRSFRKVVELDPQAAMGYWGIAISAGPYINMDGDPTYNMKIACDAVDAGLKLTAVPDKEQAYLRAVATRCPDFKDPQAYVEAMRELARRYPDDLDAGTLFAESIMVPARWKWYGVDGTPVAGMPEAERTLEAVLRRWPEHPGANHYYIHAVESSPTPERAVPSAQRLMGIMPAAGHMVHMPAHIWLVMGDFELAASLNEHAASVDREYFAASHVHGAYHNYFIHNLHFVTYAREMQGNKAGFARAAREMSEGLAPMAAMMPEMADGFNAVVYLGWVRFHDWDAVLKFPQPSGPASGTIWRFARALAYAGKNDRANAVKEQALFEQLRQQAPADAAWGVNRLADVLTLASTELAARLAPAPADAVPLWRRAVELQDHLVYDEPPAWYYPIRESLGAALLRAGMKAEAEAVLREGVRRSPRNGRMLFGLMEALRAQGKNDAVDSVQREFNAAWSKADITLSLDTL